MHESWLKAALLGVSDVNLPVPDGRIGQLLQSVQQPDDPALGFSRMVGIAAVCHVAGMTPTHSEAPMPTPADNDPHVLAADHPLAGLAREVFDVAAMTGGYEQRLRIEFCLQLAKRSRSLPHSVLVSALTAAARLNALRAPLQMVLGTRGRWLAAQNPDWSFAAGTVTSDAIDDPQTWLHGSPADRLAWFVRTRARDPELARQCLRDALSEMAVKERLPLVSALETNLSMADLSLLESLLKDRSREVREQAAGMLALLPESSHARQLETWLSALVQQKRGWLSTSLMLDAPTSVDPAWAALMVEAKRPQHEPLGERAFWLFQIVRQVRLTWWTEHTGMSPEALVQWASKSDWALALHRGWRERVSAREPEWAEALLQHKHKSLQHQDAALLTLLPLARRETFWAKDVEGLIGANQIAALIEAIAPGETLSLNYSRTLLPSVLAVFADDRLRHDYSLRPWLLELASVLHPECLRALPALNRRPDETPAMLECVNNFERIVRIRANFQPLAT